MSKTNIEWATDVWNPVTGCTKVSEGCRNCYADGMVHRFPALNNGQPFTKVQLHPDRLDQPLRWRKPRRVFVNSMSDLFHEDVPERFIDAAFATMALADSHQFLILTKRPDRMADWFRGDDRSVRAERVCEAAILQEAFPGQLDDWPRWPLPNVWLGVSVEDQKTADERIPLLLQTPAAVRFVSVEPMLGPVDLDLMGPGKKVHVLRDAPYFPGVEHTGKYQSAIDWVICGGESGHKARPMHPDWARSLRDQCIVAGVPFFFKQWGEWAPNCLCDTKRPHRTIKRPEPGKPGVVFKCGKTNSGDVLDGERYEQFPEVRP